MVEWALKKYDALRIKNARDQEMADKYPEFKRNDTDKVKRLYMYMMAPLIFVRVILGWSAAVICWMNTSFWTIGIDLEQPIPMWRRRLIYYGCNFAGRLILAQGNILSIKNVHTDFDYKQYLGPDWKPSFEEAGTVVSTHQTFLDVMVHMTR
jgi:hypothetical protein